MSAFQHAATGKEAWRTKIGDINRGETMAPLVINGKVLVGDSGGELGVRGWIKALDAGSGKGAWTAYNTGPDKDVLIGPRFKAFYARDQGKDLRVNSWPGTQWQIGGRTALARRAGEARRILHDYHVPLVDSSAAKTETTGHERHADRRRRRG